MRLLAFILLLSGLTVFGFSADSGLRIVVVVGSEGTEEYGEIFAKNALLWKEAAKKGGAAFTQIGEGDAADRSAEELKKTIAEVKEPELWLVLIGHGTFDSRTVKFNVRGPDFSDDDLAKWVEAYQGDLTVINTASASGSFVQKLSGPKRTIITATKNEAEVFYTRFGRYFSEAVGGIPEADLDNDEQVSLLESFLYASDRVEKFYESEGRLATEHALIDDNGDKLGSRSEWFEGTTATKTPGKEAEPDGELAAQKVLVKNEFERRLTQEQRTRRDELERQVKQLRREKADLEEKDYYEQLEALLLELARIYRQVESS